MNVKRVLRSSARREMAVMRTVVETVRAVNRVQIGTASVHTVNVLLQTAIHMAVVRAEQTASSVAKDARSIVLPVISSHCVEENVQKEIKPILRLTKKVFLFNLITKSG